MIRRSSCLVVALLLSGPVHAGTVMEMISKELTANPRTTTIKTYAQNGRMRVETQPGESTMIFKDDAIHALDHKRKEYSVIDRAAIKKLADQVNPALKQMQEQLAKMPPEQRAQIEKMMGNQMPGAGAEKKTELRKTNRSGKFAGYGCEYVEMYEDGVLTDEMCVAPSRAVQGSDELIATAERVRALVQEMMNAVDAPWLKQMMQRQIENYQQLGGVPVFSRHFSNGKPQSETTLQGIRTESVATSLFDIPAGYTKKDMLAQR